ncbi:glycogen-binding subunit 76A-like [Lytechinus variegatus]|uniref:glycogen-binding subunit 76A-like n=1 Tax=Lytechinus variegatus TaxID=7654 RepID=UPI001BB24D74|nr:glycogen-binding subunit 76A-like [Lytechinus variegatus]XP_041454076.1 glycogen-binding subunit 76A-like [Lytechinus variegatus]
MSTESPPASPRKARKSLAEKGQHLEPINVSKTVSSNCNLPGECRQTGSYTANTSDNFDSEQRDITNAAAERTCNNIQNPSNSEGTLYSDTVDSHCDENVEREEILKQETASAPHHAHGNFKLGADSVDLDDTAFKSFNVNVTPDGFLSPTSPTSPTSPDPDGIRSPRKSSMRDPNRPRTPPGTPSRKSVRFADHLGLDLETVKTILRTESPPDLHVHVDEEKQTISAKVLSLCFQQPGGQPDFLSRLNSLNVCLENVVVHEFTLIGTIKVRNLGFEKEVRIRQSSDNWSSYVDTMAMYVQGSCNGPTDRFSFGLSGPRSMAPGAILTFAIYYKVGGQIFWDNNGGQNYSLVCEEVKKL